MNARSEPLLWLQLIALGALPLEALLLLLLLAGADPGPFPGLERLLVWSLGGLAPAVLFWRLPPDLWSLLLAQVPLRARRPLQRRLSSLQSALPLRLLAAGGALVLLPLIWWTDSHAGVAWRISPLASSPRLVGLMLSAALLALMLWQWQQLVQALWMLSQGSDRIAATEPLSFEQIAERRLNCGLPLLLLPALEAADDVSQGGPNGSLARGFARGRGAPGLDAPNIATPEASTALNEASEAHNPAGGEAPEAPPEPEPPEADATDRSGPGGINGGIAIPPEQGPEQGQGSDLDQQI